MYRFLTFLIFCLGVSVALGDDCSPPPSLFSGTTLINLPSQPNVHFSLLNNAQNYLNIEVEFDFVQDNSMYIWDFVFNDYTNNRVYDSYNRSYTSNHPNINDFQDLDNWRSPSSACNLSDSMTYQFNRWSVHHQGSNRMSSSASFDAFSLVHDLAYSLDSQGNRRVLPLATSETTTNGIVIRGTFYIYLAYALPFNFSINVDKIAAWEYPFEIQYEKFLANRNDIVVSTENGTDINLPVINLHGLDIISSGEFSLSFDTELKSTSAVYAGNPKVMSSPVPMVLKTDVSTSACVSPCTQRWTFTSSNVSQSYSGNYTFAFQVLSVNGKRAEYSTYFTVKMSIDLEIRATINVNERLLSSLKMFQDSIYSPEHNYFTAGDTVFAVHTPKSEGMRLTPHNAWLCVQNNNTFLATCVNSSNSIQLVCDGSICPGSEAAQFRATIHDNPYYGVVSFVAQSLIGSDSSALYVFEVSSSLAGQTSDNTYVRSALLKITKQQQPPAPIPDDEDNDSNSFITTPSFLLMAFFVVFSFRC